MRLPAMTLELAPPTGTSGFLGERLSVTGRRWLPQPLDSRLAQALCQRLDLPEVVGRVLAARGVGLEAAADFLDPTLRAHLPDPSRLHDMDRGARRLAEAIGNGEPVAVFADYDVDGATSAALLHRFFAALGSELRVYVPDRLREGYGPSAEPLLRLAREGVRVVVTVDCGITAHQPLQAARAAGLDVIVVDHHAAEVHLPPATAVINPNRLDDTSGQGHLAAVGVTFLLLVAINRCLRERGFFRQRPEPDLRRWLDLVALGTVCDVVPLTGVNRAFVAQGLKVMAAWNNAGLRALATGAGLDRPPGTYHVGFVFGPRINAAGRVGDAGLGWRLLACDDAVTAADLARRLDQANRARQEIEAAVVDEALARIAAADADRDSSPVVVVAAESWHPGVVGIVASRLVERLQRPVCVVALRDGIGTGSGRSLPGVDLGAAILAARHAGLLLRGGGHAMAAGFQVEQGRLPELAGFLGERLAVGVAAARAAPALYFDGSVSVSGAKPELASLLARLEPFGAGNPEPRLFVESPRVASAGVVGGGHVRCVLADPWGGRVDAIAFRAADQPLGRALLADDGRPLHVAGRLRENTWGGRVRAQFVIDDAAGVFPG
jgi:single-stranded-DNA-specific exonuclease